MKPAHLMKVYKYIKVPLCSNLSSCRLGSERVVRLQGKSGRKGFLKVAFSRSMMVIFDNSHGLMHVNTADKEPV